MNSKEGRVYGLDILRALAILFVVFGHGLAVLDLETPYRFKFLPTLDGVLLFFVLSGFLIGSILIRLIEKRGASAPVLGEFWMRRWMRTLPAYFVALMLIVVAHKADIYQFGAYFIFSQNLASPHPPFFQEAWSLAVEEWFYLIVPFALFFGIKLLKTNTKTAVVLLVFAICVISLLIRYNLYLKYDHTWDSWSRIFRTIVITRLDSLMFGVLGAYFNYYHRPAWLRHKKSLFLGGIAIVLLDKIAIDLINPALYGQQPGLYHLVFSFTAGPIGVLLLLPLLSNLKEGKGYVFRLVTFVSLISYSLYLLHHSFVIGYVCRKFSIEFAALTGNEPSTWMVYLLYWIASIALSFLLYKFVELPFMQLRDKYFRDKPRSEVKGGARG
jgi:peptidoglycan/LPS O-acetylase OafA/YrhL